jgi:hypothetical protein
MFVFMNTRMSRNGRTSSPQLGHVVQHAHDDQAAHTDSGFHGEPAQANTTLNLSTSTEEGNHGLVLHIYTHTYIHSPVGG